MLKIKLYGYYGAVKHRPNNVHMERRTSVSPRMKPIERCCCAISFCVGPLCGHSVSPRVKGIRLTSIHSSTETSSPSLHPARTPFHFVFVLKTVVLLQHPEQNKAGRQTRGLSALLVLPHPASHQAMHHRAARPVLPVLPTRAPAGGRGLLAQLETLNSAHVQSVRSTGCHSSVFPVQHPRRHLRFSAGRAPAM